MEAPIFINIFLLPIKVNVVLADHEMTAAPPESVVPFIVSISKPEEPSVKVEIEKFPDANCV